MKKRDIFRIGSTISLILPIREKNRGKSKFCTGIDFDYL